MKNNNSKTTNIKKLEKRLLDLSFSGGITHAKDEFKKIKRGSLIKYCHGVGNDHYIPRLVLWRKGNLIKTINRWEQNYEYFKYEKKGIGYSATEMKVKEEHENQTIRECTYEFIFNDKENSIEMWKQDRQTHTPSKKMFKTYDQLLKEKGI